MSVGRAALVVLLLAGTAQADVTAAARAFNEGQAAQLAGDYDRAAQDYELAYSISPTKEALRSAVRARLLAGQLARAATLAEQLIAAYDKDAPSVKLAKEVLDEARAKLARVELVCSADCTIAVDGKAIALANAPHHVFYLGRGEHAVEVGFDGDLSVHRNVDAEPGVEVKLTIDKPAPKKKPPPTTTTTTTQQPQEPPPPPPPPRPATPKPLPRIVPIVGGAVTLGLAAVTTWSGLDTLSAHDKYAKNPTPAGYSSGKSKQLRTNILLGSTLGVGVATAVVALFYTRWHDEAHGPAMTATLAPTDTGAGWTLALGGRF